MNRFVYGIVIVLLISILALESSIQPAKTESSTDFHLYDTIEVVPHTTEATVSVTFEIIIRYYKGFELWPEFNGTFRLAWNETFLDFAGSNFLWDFPQVTFGKGYVDVKYESPPHGDTMLIKFAFEALYEGETNLHLCNTNISTVDGQVKIRESSSSGGEVKFRGFATTAEEWGDFVCYGSYCCNASVGEILSDPNNTLSIGNVVTVCYNNSLSIKVGDYVECYGYYWKGLSPLQCVGKICCENDGYYVVPEFPSFLILPLFMTLTLLAVIVYKRKHSN
jgi:hypothetical protein